MRMDTPENTNFVKYFLEKCEWILQKIHKHREVFHVKMRVDTPENTPKLREVFLIELQVKNARSKIFLIKKRVSKKYS